MAPTSIEKGRTLPARSLDFWFDYTCPWAYLGSTLAREVAARMGVPLTYRPLLLGGVFRAIGATQDAGARLPPASDARKAYESIDRARWAARRGVTLVQPAGHPLRSVEALRATLATGIDPVVVDGFYRAYWVDGRQISSPEVIRDVVAAAGHDPAAVLARIDTVEIKDDLRRRTEEGVALGIFGVPTWVVDGAHLYWGQDRVRFVEGVATPAPARAMPARSARPRLEVYWDFSSPFSYLGAEEVAAVAARTQAEVTWKPVLLGGLFRAIGTADVPFATFSPAKQRHVLADLDRWAALGGVPFKFPSRFPFSSVRPLRVFLALPEERRDAYRVAVFRAAWAEDRDVEDRAVLGACIGDDAAARAAFERAESPEVKLALRASTEEAAARGVFGAPSFFVGSELYWGRDRLELVEEALGRGTPSG